MSLTRREFLQILAAASAAGISLPGYGVAAGKEKADSDIYELPKFGNVSLLHITDVHAQLLPIWFREPNINIGIGKMQGQAPHLVGQHYLRHYGIAPGSAEAHAFTHLDFVEASKRYGKVGGFAHLATLVKKMREQRPGALLLDGGDTWQGSATSLWTKGQDMIDACKLLGVKVMTAHWEFTYGDNRVKEVLEKDLKGHIDFVAQNVFDTEWNERIFTPSVTKTINGVPVAIIGQAFPYTPVANPRYMIPTWSFGIRDEEMQKQVDKVRAEGAKIVVVLSHNGMDVDLKMASRVTGIDVILGGHTHDAVPKPITVSNASGKTLVINSGSNGKFLSVLDLDVKDGRLRDFRYRLLPVFSNLLAPDREMAALIERVRAPFKAKLEEKLAVTDDLLYRRGNFNGTFDQLILDALLAVKGADLAFSPGFRWGTSLLPGDTITMEDVMNQTAITYPTSTLTDMTGSRIKEILEDVADNLYNQDPYYQQGGDMVRVGALKYAIEPNSTMNKRISAMELKGKPLALNKTYKVAGWAPVSQPMEGAPIWDVVAEYLRNAKHVKIGEPNVPLIKGIKQNPGLA
ncbi:MAG: thiosulfohydrolase SoxB [Pseudomonadota bacterium]